MKSRTFFLIVGSIVGTVLLGVVALCAWGAGRDEAVSVASLIRGLKAGTATHRRDAATALGQVVGPGAKGAVAALIRSLGDVDPEVRARSARSLGSILTINPGHPLLDDATSALMTALHDSALGVRVAAADGLRSLDRGAAGMFEVAIEGLHADDDSLRAESAGLLSGLPGRNPDDLRRLFSLLDDPSAAVRRASREALIRPSPALSPAIALSVIASEGRDGSTTAREVAATMLGRSVAATPAGRDLLIIALNDPATAVRLAASEAMAAYSEDPLARFALQLATDDPDLAVRAAASASLAVARRATRAEALADLKIATEHDPARADLAALAEAGPGRATPRLIDAIGDPDPRLRAAAARCLGEIVPRDGRTPAIVDALIAALADRDPSVRRASAAALARYGPEATDAIDALKRAARDVDRGVSGQAFLTLRELEDSRVR